VMSFIGPVTRFGDMFVRPHDLEVLVTPLDDGSQAVVERVVYLGFEVRVELRRADGVRVWAQLPRDEAARLALLPGQVVAVRSRRELIPVAA
jgi:sulfate transport system ATP-binding protein